MDWHIVTCFFLISVEEIIDLDNILVVTCIRRSEDNKDANGVFVDVFANFGSIKAIIGFFADRNDSCLNFKVPSEFSRLNQCKQRTRAQLGH
jgi:hypothetical protein